VLAKTALGWVLTLIIAGIGAGIVVAQGVHAPLAGSINSPDTAQVIFLERVCPQYITMQDPVNFVIVNETLACL
jgi:hypothetical protein